MTGCITHHIRDSMAKILTLNLIILKQSLLLLLLIWINTLKRSEHMARKSKNCSRKRNKLIPIRSIKFLNLLLSKKYLLRYLKRNPLKTRKRSDGRVPSRRLIEVNLKYFIVGTCILFLEVSQFLHNTLVHLFFFYAMTL